MGHYILPLFKELRPEVEYLIILYYLLFITSCVTNTLCWTSITNRHQNFITAPGNLKESMSFFPLSKQVISLPSLSLVKAGPKARTRLRPHLPQGRHPVPVLNDSGHLARLAHSLHSSLRCTAPGIEVLHPLLDFGVPIQYQALGLQYQALGLLKMVPQPFKSYPSRYIQDKGTTGICSVDWVCPQPIWCYIFSLVGMGSHEIIK